MSEYIETNFDETSGIIPCFTQWGKWWQTVQEVCIEIDLPKEISAKVVKVDVKPNFICTKVEDQTIFEGTLFGNVKADETCWTLVDKKIIQIVLTKSIVTKDITWDSLLQNQFEADPMTLLNMRKKIDLEKYQMQNPGFDFSSAELNKCYD